MVAREGQFFVARFLGGNAIWGSGLWWVVVFGG